MALLSSSVPSDQVEQREQEDPDDVDEVPVKADALDVVVVIARRSALVSSAG